MQAHDNAYAAPQTTDFRVAKQRPFEHFAARFPVKYLWQGMARGLAAGLLASLSMIFLYLVRMLSGYQADSLNLLLIAGIFIVVTMVLGLVWGIAYACLASVMPDTFVELNDAVSSSDDARGAS